MRPNPLTLVRTAVRALGRQVRYNGGRNVHEIDTGAILGARLGGPDILGDAGRRPAEVTNPHHPFGSAEERHVALERLGHHSYASLVNYGDVPPPPLSAHVSASSAIVPTREEYHGHTVGS